MDERKIRPRDLGDRVILLGTEQGIDPPLCLVGKDIMRHIKAAQKLRLRIQALTCRLRRENRRYIEGLE